MGPVVSGAALRTISTTAAAPTATAASTTTRSGVAVVAALPLWLRWALPAFGCACRGIETGLGLGNIAARFAVVAGRPLLAGLAIVAAWLDRSRTFGGTLRHGPGFGRCNGLGCVAGHRLRRTVRAITARLAVAAVTSISAAVAAAAVVTTTVAARGTISALSAIAPFCWRLGGFAGFGRLRRTHGQSGLDRIGLADWPVALAWFAFGLRRAGLRRLTGRLWRRLCGWRAGVRRSSRRFVAACGAEGHAAFAA